MVADASGRRREGMMENFMMIERAQETLGPRYSKDEYLLGLIELQLDL